MTSMNSNPFSNRRKLGVALIGALALGLSSCAGSQGYTQPAPQQQPAAYEQAYPQYAPPQWAPAYSNVQNVGYYYLPDYNMYYDVGQRVYWYQNNGMWYSSYDLPPAYYGSNLNGTYVVFINRDVDRPWTHHQYYVDNYSRHLDDGNRWRYADDRSSPSYNGGQDRGNTNYGNNNSGNRGYQQGNNRTNAPAQVNTSVQSNNQRSNNGQDSRVPTGYVSANRSHSYPAVNVNSGAVANQNNGFRVADAARQMQSAPMRTVQQLPNNTFRNGYSSAATQSAQPSRAQIYNQQAYSRSVAPMNANNSYQAQSAGISRHPAGVAASNNDRSASHNNH